MYIQKAGKKFPAFYFQTLDNSSNSMKPVFKIPLTISLFIFLVSVSTVAKAQLAIGIGTSAYYNRLYDRTGFPLTLVGEFDQIGKGQVSFYDVLWS